MVIYNDSQLAKLWSVAFLEYVKSSPGKYNEWYQTYLGADRSVPELTDSELDWDYAADIEEGTQLHSILYNNRPLRIGFVPEVFGGKAHSPYCSYNEENKLTGIEFEISHAVAKVIRFKYNVPLKVDWVRVDATALDGTANDNQTMFNDLAAQLELNNIDIALSGIIDHNMMNDSVTAAWPTLTFFTGAMYTGKTDGSVGDINEAMKTLVYNGEGSETDYYDKLVAFLKDNPGISMTAMTGPSFNAASFLWKKAYGFDATPSAAELTEAKTASDMGLAIADQTHHLVVADAMILGDFSTDPSLDTVVNLNFNTRFKAMDESNADTLAIELIADTNFMGPFVWKG